MMSCSMYYGEQYIVSVPSNCSFTIPSMVTIKSASYNPLPLVAITSEKRTMRQYAVQDLFLNHYLKRKG